VFFLLHFSLSLSSSLRHKKSKLDSSVAQAILHAYVSRMRQFRKGKAYSENEWRDELDAGPVFLLTRKMER
jgi:hypothetical protein